MKVTNTKYILSIAALFVIPFAVAIISISLALHNPVYLVVGVVLVFAATVACVMLYGNICNYHAQMPLNALCDYEIRFMHFADLGEIDQNGVLTAEIREIKKGVWLLEKGQVRVIFDLNRYISLVSWLRAYFVRQAVFHEINVNRYTVEKLFTNCKLTTLERFKSMKMVFVRSNGHKVTRWIIRNKRCRNTNRIKQINNALIRGKFDRQVYKNAKIVFKKVDESFIADDHSKKSVLSEYTQN